VGPQKVKPRFLRSFESASLIGVDAGTLLMRRKFVLHRLAVDEFPDIAGETAGLLVHDLQITARVLDRTFDLAAMADDAFVLQELSNLGFGIARDLLRHEAVESAAKIIALCAGS